MTASEGTAPRAAHRGSSPAHLSWRIAGETMIACYPLALALVLIKHELLAESGGLQLVARQLSGNHSASLGAFHHLSLFAGDLLEAFGLVPLLLLAALGWTRRRTRILLTSLAIAGLIAIAGAAWLTVLAIGGLPTVGLARDYLQALRSDPGIVSAADYVPRAAELRVVLLVLAGLLPGLLLIRRGPGREGSRLVAMLGALGGAAVIAALGLSVGVRGKTIYHTGTLWRVASEFFRSPGVDLGALPRQSLEDLRRSWSVLSGVDTASPGLPRLADGTACRSAILVLLESASARDYPIDAIRKAMPGIRGLLDHAIIARRQLATHQASNRAEWSLFAGFNDFAGGVTSEELQERALAPAHPNSIAWILRNQGYETSYYYPGAFTIRRDRGQVSYLGFEQVHWAGGRSGDAEARVAAERQMFARAARDLQESATPARPFFMVLRSMVGHDPMFSLRTLVNVPPTDRAGRRQAAGEILGEIDSLLATVLDAAARREDPDRIAVIITGDHGLRDRLDPDLEGHLFNPVSYHVPMVISCPARFPQPIEIEATTSHVDFAPTLAWLLGVPARPWLHSGLVMLDPRVRDRFVFMLGDDSHGVDAVIHADTIVAVNRVTGTLHHFLFAESLLPATPAFKSSGEGWAHYRSAIERLNGIAQVQEATLRYLIVDH